MKITYENISGYELAVVLPYLYDQNKQYEVMYLQDYGQAARLSLNYIDHLIRNESICPVVIIGIKPKNRMHEYTPWPASSLSEHKPSFEGKAKSYLDVLVNDIKPFIDSHYAVYKDSSHTAIGGCSLGGLLTIYASYTHPETFGKFTAISPSLWYQDFMHFIKEQQPSIVLREKHKMYLYVGRLEGFYKKSAQKYMEKNTDAAYKHLKEEGFKDKNIIFETDTEGTHDYLFFSRYFINSLKWMYGK